MKHLVRTAHPTAKMDIREYDDGSLTIVAGNETFRLHPARAAALRQFLGHPTPPQGKEP